MDQARSLVPLSWHDPAVCTVPLVGIWVLGADDVRHPLVAAACIRFLSRQESVVGGPRMPAAPGGCILGSSRVIRTVYPSLTAAKS